MPKKPTPLPRDGDPDAPASPPKVASGDQGGNAAPGGGSFGAEGPASVRDLGRAFTRALPPASNADPTWGKLAAGSAGSVDVAIVISEEGKITGVEPLAPNPPAHLVSTVKRTIALLRGGVFALQGGSVTKGRQILRLKADLSDTPVADEEASGGGAVNLAFRWEGKRGVASFTQSSGRHVEITIEFLRVEIEPG